MDGSRYRPEIDGLRAVAVAPVILFHAGFRPFAGGFVGVDVFFVISGYLITNIIYREISVGDFSVARFYERRARRILPALFLVCLACIPFAYLWMVPGDLKDFSRSLVAVNLFVSNILFWRESGYFAAAAELKPLIHTWSLAIEEQFYIFFPLFLLVFRKLSRRSLILLICVLSLGSLAIAEYGSRHYPTANFFLLPSRAWELGVGALLALAMGSDRIESGSIRQVGSLLGLGLIGVAVFAFDATTPFPSLWALVPVAGTALVIACSGGGDIAGRVLGWKPVVGVGLVSYSLYLWHQPLFAFARLRSLEEPGTGSYVALIAASFLLAILSWRFIEAPFRNRRVVSVRRMAAWTAPAAAGMIALGVWGHETRGFRFLAPEAIRNIEDRLAGNNGLSPDCRFEFTLSARCRTSDRPEVVVWGDSYAMHLVDGIVASDPRIELVQHTMARCGPILGIAPIIHHNPDGWAAECIEFNESVFDYLRHTPTIKYAVVSSPFSQYVGDDAMVMRDERVFAPNVRFIADRIKETASRLRDIGIEMIVVSPPPSNGMNIGRCLAKSSKLGYDAHLCDIVYDDFLHERINVVDLFDRLTDSGIKTVRLSDYMCDDEYCYSHEGDVFFYTDDGHLTEEGSAYLGKKFGFADLMR